MVTILADESDMRQVETKDMLIRKTVDTHEELSARTFMFLVIPFVTFIIYLTALFYTLPQLSAEDRARGLSAMTPPLKLQGALDMRDIFSGYTEDHPLHVALVLSSLYVFMQCFAIPGTLTLSLLAGALFGFYKGVALVVCVNATGSSLCFAINTVVGRAIANRLWPQKIEAFKREVRKRRSQLAAYIFFLRVTPFLPNTFINVASPVVHIPYRSYLLGSVFGTLPNSLVSVNAGMHLSEVNSLSELFDSKMVLAFAAIGLLVLLPVMLTTPPDFSSSDNLASTDKKKTK
mmetsp:Transcript_23933/g.32918  ORF Transcript_23933/g.32918 Transcript_23933/m.32918 type:complete len:290 (-) Transcript_23933:53-922(-)